MDNNQCKQQLILVTPSLQNLIKRLTRLKISDVAFPSWRHAFFADRDDAQHENAAIERQVSDAVKNWLGMSMNHDSNVPMSLDEWKKKYQSLMDEEIWEPLYI